MEVVIKIDLQDAGWKPRTGLIAFRDMYRAVVGMVMNFGVHITYLLTYSVVQSPS